MQSILSGTKIIYTNKFEKYAEYSILEMHKLFNSRDVKILLKLVSSLLLLMQSLHNVHAHNLFSYLERGGQK